MEYGIWLALLNLLNNWENPLDTSGFVSAILISLSKTFVFLLMI